MQTSLAKRYLRFTLPGGRLDGESYDQSIVNNAFNQAWGVVARRDLSAFGIVLMPPNTYVS